jgi:uncharacterized protein YbjQ (UPF0145 family)
MKTKVALFALVALAGCATQQLSPAAARIQFQPANSTMISQCKMLGPVQATASDLMPQDANNTALRGLREQGARMGADTIALTNKEVNGGNFSVTRQGTALKCYP